MRNRGIIFYIILFILVVLAQGLLFDQFEPGWGIHIMIYPMFILLLPFETRPIYLLFYAFLLGLAIDTFTNSFGLHTSSALVLAYFRPQLYALLESRDGYDVGKIATFSDMKRSWFFRAYGFGLLIHHLFFFTLEMFKFSDFFFIIQKTIFSVIASFLMILFIQLIFLNRANKS